VTKYPRTPGLLISFCKSFTSELHKNIGPDFVEYQTIDDIIDADKVIVQYKSVCRLKVCNLDKTILILDEAKLILTQTELESIIIIVMEAGTQHGKMNKVTNIQNHIQYRAYIERNLPHYAIALGINADGHE